MFRALTLKLTKPLAFVTATLSLAAPAIAESYRDNSVPMTVETGLDLDRYLGKWHEIARFPNRFEKNCFAVTAEYAVKDNGNISVLNTCRDGAVDGPVKQAEGAAFVAAPGKLEVSFVPFLSFLSFVRGDYWVLDVTPDYSVAVVGAPSGDTGWILARAPEISGAELQAALSVLEANGYDVSQIRMVPQNTN